MSRFNSALAFVFLIILYMFALLIAAARTNIILMPVILILCVSVFFSTHRQNKTTPSDVTLPNTLIPSLAVALGAFSTFYLVKSGLSAVLASGLIGILGSVLFKRYEVEIFTGSFVGMSSVVLFNDVGLMFASLIAYLVYFFGKKVFVGIGGKLGSSAFAGTVITAVLLGVNPLMPDTVFINTSLPGWLISITLISGSLACVITYLVSKHWFKGSTVIGSSLIGIVGYFGSLLLGSFGPLFAGTIYAATFAGMSQEKVLKNPRFFAIAGLITSILFLLSSNYFLGLGGKMGLSAFIGVIGTLPLIKKG